MSHTLNLSVGYHTERGAKPDNQDFCGWLAPSDTLLTSKGIAVLLADGVSACDAGGDASEFSVKGFINDYFSTPESWSVKTSGQKVLAALNNWLYGEGQKRAESRRGLVTTFSALVVKSTTAHIFHVGDSCIALVRDGCLERLTRLHRVRVSADKEYLSRALGMDTDLDIDFHSIPLQVGDCFLLMTDGVSDYVTDAALLELLTHPAGDWDQVARNICATALANHSPDNLTCMVAEVVGLPPQEADEVYRVLTQLPFPPELNPGMILDGYRIQQPLHASSTSQLYLAVDIETKQPVVIKTPSVNFQDDPAYIERFHHEEWAGKRIDNRHVLKVLEPGHRRRFLYLVMEYLEGQTLREWMTDNPQPEINKVREIVDQITAGLRAFHRLEMLHRDIKPENIFIQSDGQVKLIDFGSVKIAGIAEISTPVQRQENLGTRNYSAPEYFHGQTGSRSSDIFSLGVVVYEMLTGQLPYASPDKLLYTPSSTHTIMIPHWMDKALEKATHPLPMHRYEVLSEFLQDFAYPNPKFSQNRPVPLIERNPLLFWKFFSLSLFILNLVLFYALAIQ